MIRVYRLPAFIRARVQAGLTLLWTLHLPLLQPSSPASLVARTLHTVLGNQISEYTYVDFCAGAGGPTPYFEADLNAQLASNHKQSHDDESLQSKDHVDKDSTESYRPVDFVLTDIAPHISAWNAAAQKSPHLHYVSKSIDAANAPTDMLDSLGLASRPAGQKVVRLFSLAFHHFPDPLARSILENTLKTSSGFAILELQGRTLASCIMIALMGPLILLVTPFYFWRDPIHLIFTYLIPIIPIVLVFDGFVSSIRTRTGEEVKQMADALEGDASANWEFRWGTEWHTKVIGEMTWIIGIKKDS